jgi:DNA-binding MarR family transcriptional regulator
VGVNLIVEVLDHAPDGLTAGERLLLVVLAEQARDTTRIALPGEDVMAHRTGMTDRTVRRALARLCDAGVIERVALGTDRAGRPVFARRGRRAEFRIAHLSGKADVSDRLPEHERRTPESAFPEEKGGRLGPERRTPRTGKADMQSVRPSVSPVSNPSSARESPDHRHVVIDALHERTGKTITEDHAAAVARQILAGATVRSTPERYLRGVIERDPDPHRFLPTPTPPRYVRHA